MATCQQCGADRASDAKFCGECGAPAAAPTASCQLCGDDVTPGSIFCGGCGAPVVAGDLAQQAVVRPPTVIATFNSSTGWAGKAITHDNGVFMLEGQGPITARDVISYDDAGQIEWAYEGLKDWTCQMRDQPAAPAEFSAAAAGILFQGLSHEAGRNAEVTLFRNRIERVKQRSRASFSKAHQEVEVTPMKSVTSVKTKKDGISRTKVTVYASANAIDFRFEHAEAQAFKEAVMRLILDND